LNQLELMININNMK